MSYSSSLTDREWEIIQPLLPQKKKTNPGKWSKRQILDGVLYQLKNGCNWQDLPKDFPPYSTVYWHYKPWRSEGVMETIMTPLHGKVREQMTKAYLSYLLSPQQLKRKLKENLVLFQLKRGG